ncbi:MAG: baeRF3 domain-containing protein [Planctomycetota bacterium]|jgi:hypothetical protein
MDRMSREDLRGLLRAAQAPCISIYVPTHGEASWIEHDRIALKNLIGDAAGLLVSGGVRRPDAEALLGPASALLEDSFFWGRLGRGLAIFACPGFFARFRLPVTFDAKAVAAERFHIRPLLDLFTGEGVFYVLVLSTKGARLHRATRFESELVSMPAAPRNLAEELMFDDFEKHVDLRAGTPGGHGRSGAVVFGDGGAAETVKEELLRYFRDVDRGLHGVLRSEHGPVVLAGVRYFQAIFRDASSCGHLVEGGVEGSPEQTDDDELIARARALVEPVMRRAEAVAMDRYRASAGRGLASDDVGEVVSAARAGRVGVLLSARGRDRWGKLDLASGRVAAHEVPEPGDEDLAELATAETIAHGGSVYSVEPERLPEGAALAAVYRY